MTAQVLLDVSALLAVVFEETGCEKVIPRLAVASISAVNYSEVLAKQIQRGANPARVVEGLRALGLETLAWDADLAELSVDLSPLGWTHGLSFGDRACLATARRLKRTVLTAERAWRKLPKLAIDIQFIR
jgi:ribonuclease VapC